jgi:hypothetical protein
MIAGFQDVDAEESLLGWKSVTECQDLFSTVFFQVTLEKFHGSIQE